MTGVTQPQPFACPACSATIFWPPLPAKQSAKKQKIEFWSDGYDPNAPTNLVDCPFCLSLFPRYFATSLSHVTGVVPRLDYLTPVVAVRNDDNSDVSSSIENLARIPGYKSWRGAVYLGPRPLEDADPIFLALCIESILHSFNNRVRVKARSGQKNSSLSAESVMSSFLGGLITQVGFSDAYESPHSNIFGMDMTVEGKGPEAYKWYDAASGGTLLFTGSSFTTPVLNNNTTYYVQDSTCGASATRTAIAVTVIPIPAAPTNTTPT
ncbi:MAG: hypothetical protein WCO84_08690, partial [bacterium]